MAGDKLGHSQDDVFRHIIYTPVDRRRLQKSGACHRNADVWAPNPAAVPSCVKPNSETYPGNAGLRNRRLGSLPTYMGDRVVVLCGPLLNYRRIDNKTWFGSVLVVTSSGDAGKDMPAPELHLKVKKASADDNEDRHGESPDIAPATSAKDGIEEVKVKGTKLYSDPDNTFWRKSDKQIFYVPATSDSMRMLFYSCNGFSVGTDEDAFSGACLWKDVSREHKRTPFHVMIGGGDQIYNDGIRVNGPLRSWTDLKNPREREKYPFSQSLRKACDYYYVNNYIQWYGTEPFASCNGKIPQLNIWDDHDIIDGFGSYVDSFMNCPVFKGIGGVANKYYLLFQHHLAPPPYTFTPDAPETARHNNFNIDLRQLQSTYVLNEPKIDPSYIIGANPGPYLKEHSRSVYTRLGARIAFIGIDARTERTRTQVNYPDTYEIIFKRIREDLGAAKNLSSPIRHLIVLLGIPIAYPRLTWLESVFRSPIIGPIRFLNKRFGCGGSFFNHFDGSVDLLDDLDDHYTARAHKKERLFLIHQLQDLAAEFSVRVTILGGDVHLAAIGRFYSNPKLCIPISRDYRYMANIISSAIVNKPPPQAVANFLAMRNKIHRLDENTDETLMRFFDQEPGKLRKNFNSNHLTMPRRNWAMITENGLAHAQAFTEGNPNDQKSYFISSNATKRVVDGHTWLHDGEIGAGTLHKAANPELHGKGNDGSLDVCIRVEIDQHDNNGKTELYGMTIPVLALRPQSS